MGQVRSFVRDAVSCFGLLLNSASATPTLPNQREYPVSIPLKRWILMDRLENVFWFWISHSPAVVYTGRNPLCFRKDRNAHARLFVQIEYSRYVGQVRSALIFYALCCVYRQTKREWCNNQLNWFPVPLFTSSEVSIVNSTICDVFQPFWEYYIQSSRRGYISYTTMDAFRWVLTKLPFVRQRYRWCFSHSRRFRLFSAARVSIFAHS